MNDRDFFVLIDEERRQTRQRASSLQHLFDEIVEASESAALDDEHDPDGSTVAFERAQVASLLDQLQQRLRALDEAEQRLRDGTFGRCQKCGTEISTERLRSVPLATGCVGC